MIRDVFVQSHLKLLRDPKLQAELLQAGKLRPEEPLTAPSMNFGAGELVQYGNPVTGLPYPEAGPPARVADYSGQAAPAHNVTTEEPLVAPVMNFDDLKGPGSKVPTTSKPKGHADNGEEPLLLPVMEF